MDELLLKVLGLHRAEFEKAKQYEMYSWYSELVATMFALFAVFITIEILIYVFSVFSLFAVIGKWYWSHQSKQFREVAERARRILNLVDGLGYRISHKEISDLIASFSVSDIEGIKWEDQEYFVDKEERGYYQFGTLIQQNTFFSKRLYKKSAKTAWRWLFIGFMASILALLSLPSITNQKWELIFAQIVSAFLIFLVSIDILGKALGFSTASSAMEKIDDRLEKFRSPDFDNHDLIYIWSDYNAIVQNAPMIPTSVYEKNIKLLNELYDQGLKR